MAEWVDQPTMGVSLATLLEGRVRVDECGVALPDSSLAGEVRALLIECQAEDYTDAEALCEKLGIDLLESRGRIRGLICPEIIAVPPDMDDGERAAMVWSELGRYCLLRLDRGVYPGDAEKVAALLVQWSRSDMSG